jgi:hypothetical protein
MASERMLHTKLACWYLNLDAKGLKYMFDTFHNLSFLFHFTTYNTNYSKLL